MLPPKNLRRQQNRGLTRQYQLDLVVTLLVNKTRIRLLHILAMKLVDVHAFAATISNQRAAALKIMVELAFSVLQESTAITLPTGLGFNVFRARRVRLQIWARHSVPRAQEESY
jgi:hypothetical protein